MAETEAKWYVVHTYSGYENKVRDGILNTVENRADLKDTIMEVRIPVETVIENKDGKKKTYDRKLFPGYVLVNMIMNDDTWYVIRNTRGVTGFVGPGSKPVPLTETEMKSLGIKTESIAVDFAEGDMVVVIAGLWKDNVGIVQRMDLGKQTATIMVDMFGRETPVEISFSDMKKSN